MEPTAVAHRVESASRVTRGWLAAGAATVVASLGAAAVFGSYGVAESSLLTGVVTGGLLPPATLLVGSSFLAAVAAASAAAVSSGRFGWAKSVLGHDAVGKESCELVPRPQSSTAADALLATEGSSQLVEVDAAQTEAGSVEDVEVPTSARLRKLHRHSVRKRLRLLDQARKEAEAWMAALMLYGVSVKVAGKSQKLRLENQPLWDTLSLGEEQLPLLGVAFRLDGSILTLACEEEDAEDSAAEQRERTFELHMANEDEALGLTLALKLLRGKTDTGAGVAAWGSRPPDRLERPPPAE